MKCKVVMVSGICVLMLFSVGIAGANNLLVNGDFSAGNTGFTTQYTFIVGNGTIETGPGDYSVITNPATAFINGYESYGDHTTGTGLMLFADGDSPGINVWGENVNAGTGAFTFTGWVANADVPLANPAVLGLFVNGTQVGDTFTITQTGGIWEEWTVQFNLHSASNIALSIQDLNPDIQDGGNDFTLDDLALSGPAGTTPEPSSLIMLGSGLLPVAFAVRRRLFGK